MVSLSVNGKIHTLDEDPSMPLLWVLRDTLKLTGTKYSCGIGQCGACTVLLDGVAVRSCQTSIDAIKNKEVVTIEGLNSSIGKALQEAWINTDVPQCGFCQSGQIMSATSLLTKNPKPSGTDIERAMEGNLCRCGTYNRVRQAIVKVSTSLAEK